jgi:hypothetical protein
MNPITMNYFSTLKELLTSADYQIVTESEEDGVLVINDENSGLVNTMLVVAEPLLVIEQVLFEANMGIEDIASSLLRKNRDLVSGAFCLDDGNRVIFRDTLRLEGIDLNKIELTLTALELILSEYGDAMIGFSKTDQL